MFWALALLSLSLAAAPAVTNNKQAVSTKGKAAASGNKTSSNKTSSNKTTGKASTATKAAAKGVSAKASPAKSTNLTKTTGKTPVKPGATTTARTKAPQPTYSRYNNTRRVSAARQRAAYHPAPMAPTVERTKEIQSALVQKGYLSGEASGNWDADTQAAMKRFQKDQNLDADGKISSLSLIALGLGPKRNLTAGSVNPPIPGSTSTPSTTNPVPPKP